MDVEERKRKTYHSQKSHEQRDVGRKSIPPSGLTEPASVHLSHVAHADQSHHCFTHDCGLSNCINCEMLSSS
jgi:hypothetical protein